MKTNLHPDAVPVRLVIGFVGSIGVLSLFIAAWLFWLGKSGEGVLAITNGCVMGLLGLLARTDTRGRQSDAPVEVTAKAPLPVEVADDVPSLDAPANDAATPLGQAPQTRRDPLAKGATTQGKPNV